MMAAILDYFSIFEILSKIESYNYKKCIGNTVFCDKNAKYCTGKKMKSNDYFSISEKFLDEFYKNPTFVTYCNDISNA